MDIKEIIIGYLALNEAGMILAAARLSKAPKPPPIGYVRRENITPTELHETMQSGKTIDLWRSNTELIDALHYAQARQEVSKANRAKIAAASPDMLQFIDEIRAAGMDPRLVRICDANGNPIKLN